MHYIGIDLAWTYANESGIVVIDGKGSYRKVKFGEKDRYESNEVNARIPSEFLIAESGSW